MEDLGLQCADSHPYPRRAYPPASEEARQLQLPHRDDLWERLPFSTVSSRAPASRLLQSLSGNSTTHAFVGICRIIVSFIPVLRGRSPVFGRSNLSRHSPLKRNIPTNCRPLTTVATGATYTRIRFPNEQIPLSRFDPVALKMVPLHQMVSPPCPPGAAVVILWGIL